MSQEETTDEKEPEPRPPLRELLTPPVAAVTAIVGVVLAVESYRTFGSSPHALVGVILGPVLALLSAIDLRHRLLPNIIVGPAAVAVGAVIAIGEPHRVVVHAAAAAAAGGVLLILVLVKPDAMGMGDAKLGFLIGLALGFQTIAAMIFTSGALILVTIFLVVRHGPAGLRLTIPFGPLLALGAMVAYYLS